jgi:serine/threonine protein kinase
MPDPDPRILDLLVRWDEARRRGETPSAADLCPDDVTLRDELARRLARRQRLLDRLDLTADYDPAAAANGNGAFPQFEGYEVVGLLGRGGSGVVYQARDVRLNRTVAIKTLLSGSGAGPEELARIHREAEAVAQLRHPNIVQIHEIGDRDGCPYLVLEYVASGSLAQHLDGTPVPAAAAARLVLPLAEAVQHAHQAGIVHRDLKPGNVLLGSKFQVPSSKSEDRKPDNLELGTWNLEPKVADFGLAKRLDLDQGQTQTGTVLGSPCYMAPEQAEGRIHEVGPATDVYALGVILYELLVGRPPFRGTTMLETLEQVRGLDPVPPRNLQPKVPRDLEAVCLKCLNKLPADRYSGADGLAADLRRFLNGEPVGARSVTLKDHLGRAIVHARIDPHLARTWGKILFALSPLPFLAQVVVYLLAWGTPTFPWAAVATTVASVIGIHGTFWVKMWPLTRVIPRTERQLIASAEAGFTVSFLLLTTLMAWRLPAYGPNALLLLYPVWLCLAGCLFFTLATYAGFMYLTGLAALAAAPVAALYPEYAPLAVGAVISTDMALQSVQFRRMGRRSVTR